jgi:DNA-binding CsgD family transcriptional regulator
MDQRTVRVGRLSLPPWHIHALLALVANVGLTGLWELTRDHTPRPGDEGAGYWWPLWVALIWGLAVLLHLLAATGRLDPPVPADADRGPPPAGTDRSAAAQPGGTLPPTGDGTGPAAGPSAAAPLPADPAPDGSPTGRLGALTGREREILLLVAAGCANKEIARRLVISERTARTHVSNILRKLEIPSRTHAALVAVRAGLPAPAGWPDPTGPAGPAE